MELLLHVSWMLRVLGQERKRVKEVSLLHWLGKEGAYVCRCARCRTRTGGPGVGRSGYSFFSLVTVSGSEVVWRQ